MFKSTSGIHQSPFTSSQTSNDQSILEMAATNKCLAEQTLSLAQDVLPAFSLAETSLMLTHKSQETGTHQQVEPTSAEKLAFQVRLVWVIYNCVVVPPFKITSGSSLKGKKSGAWRHTCKTKA